MFKSLNKGISTSVAIIIIVVCALLVGGIVVWQYYGMPKGEEEITEVKPPVEAPKDETVGWETYKNEEYGFEFSYPAYFTNIETEKLNKHPNYGGDYYFSVLISQPESPAWKYLRYFQVEVTNGIPSGSIFKLRSSDVVVGNDLRKIYWFISGEEMGGASFGQIPIQKITDGFF